MYLKTTRIEDCKDIIIINTNQNPKKIGSLVIPKSQQKEDFFAIINEGKDKMLPVIYLSKGTTKDTTVPSIYVFRIKASSPASAKSQAIKEARKRYLRYNNLNLTTSNLNIHAKTKN